VFAQVRGTFAGLPQGLVPNTCPIALAAVRVKLDDGRSMVRKVKVPEYEGQHDKGVPVARRV
jgi:hypothetical protein